MDKPTTISAFFWGLQETFRASPGRNASYLGLILIAGVAPGLSLYALGVVSKSIGAIDFVIPIIALALWGLVVLIQGTIDTAIWFVRFPLKERVLARFNLLIIERANTFEGMDPLERADYQDSIHVLKEGASYHPLNFVHALAMTLRHAIAAISICVVLGNVNAWLPFGILAVSLPKGLATIWRECQGWDLMLFRSSKARRMSWLSHLCLDPTSAQEIRSYECGPFLSKRYRRLARALLNETLPHRLRITLVSLTADVITILGTVTVLALLIRTAILSHSAYTIVLALQGLVMSQQVFPCLMEALSSFAAPMQFLKHLLRFLVGSPAKDQISGQDLPPTDINELRFEAVSFSYPNGQQALENINLTIRRGERLTLVGGNGSGKTTLIKLLARLYEPTKGRILVNGIDIKQLNSRAWRRKLAVVFQDYTNYAFTPKESIEIGDIERRPGKPSIQEAAECTGCSPFIDNLADGYETLLGKSFGGAGLSGGEWQRLALARAAYRDAELLLLDEPSASLDAPTERLIVDRLTDSESGRITILVTHRFGAIMPHSKIAVIRSGRLVQLGHHDELIDESGEYRRLYREQHANREDQSSSTKNLDASTTPLLTPRN